MPRGSSAEASAATPRLGRGSFSRRRIAPRRPAAAVLETGARLRFFGTRHWIRKLAKYQKIKAELREERKNNTDKMEAAVAWGERRREVRNERLRKKRLAAQNTQSILKRSILSAQIYALSWAAAR